MRRFSMLLLAVTAALVLLACGQDSPVKPKQPSLPAEPVQTEPSAEDLLTGANWMNIYDGDVYILNSDGTGSHNGISLVYTFDGATLSITEGVASLQSKAFHLDQSGAYLRLIPEGDDSFYVMESDYRELAPKLRRESIQILLSYEFWKASTVDGYLTFYENGTGSLKYPASNVNTDTTWEMVSNNALRCHMPIDSTKEGVNTLRITNRNGQYMLLTDDPDVFYTPYGDPRPQAAPSGSIASIEAGIGYTLCLKADGTALGVGVSEQGQRNIENWKNLSAISGSNMHTIGLFSDGTVTATGDNSMDQCNVSSWRDIAYVDTGYFHTVALRTDGTAVATGYSKNGQCDLQQWTDLIALSAGGYHTLGLKADGTVIAAGYNEDGRCDVESWTNIIAVSGGGYHSVGLKADGTVVAVGLNKDGQCDVGTWQDIIAISAGEHHTVGLKADGTLVAAGWNAYNQCHVSTWYDIVSIRCGGAHTVGMKANGTLIAIGNNDFGQCDVDTLMKNAS